MNKDVIDALSAQLRQVFEDLENKESGGFDFDGVTVEWLFTFGYIAHVQPEALSEALFASTNERQVAATLSLARYARAKAAAMKARVRGDIEAANTYEKMCDEFYGGLPTWAMW